MTNPHDFCMNCMNQLQQPKGVCPHCGFDNAACENAAYQLECGSILGGAYLVGCALGQGGFGITYVGWDLNLEQKVAIKEFYPEGCVMRDLRTHCTVITYPGERETVFIKGRDKFVDEARALAKFAKDDGIVGVRGFINENGTAYIIMDFIEGETLKSFVKKRGGKLPTDETLALFRPLFQSLGHIHKKQMLHRDISPDNIMMQSDGRLVLLDFGAARQISMFGEHTNTVHVKHGFAPEEQYRAHGEQGAWTDIYSLSATIYYLTTGTVPQQSLERMANHTPLTPPNQLGANFTRKQEKAVIKGLSVRSDQRQQSIEELQSDLFDDDGTGKSAPDSNSARKRHKTEPNESLPAKPSSEKEREQKNKITQQGLLTEEPKENEKRKHAKRSTRKIVIFGALMLTGLVAVVGIIAMVFDLIPIKQNIQDAFGKPTLQTEQDNAVEQTEDSLLVQAINLAVNQISAQKQEILQTVYQDDYLAAQTSFVAIENIKQDYYEATVHFPAPQYAADNALFENDDPQQIDGKILVFYREGIGAVPITSVEDWEAKLANGTEGELAATYAENADYSAYRKMLQDKYEIYAQQLIASDENYDAFLVYVSCGNREKTALMGKRFLEFQGTNTVLCRNGRVLSTNYNTSNWIDIKSFYAGYSFIVALKKSGEVVGYGIIAEYDKLNLKNWGNITDIYSNGEYIVGVRPDGTVLSAGGILSFSAGNKYSDLNLSNWDNIVAVDSSKNNLVIGIRKDGSLVWVWHPWYSIYDYLSEGKTNIISVIEFSGSLIGLCSDGEVKVVNGTLANENGLNSWTDIKALEVCGNYLVGIKKDGSLVFTEGMSGVDLDASEYNKLREWNNVKEVYSLHDYIICLQNDGTALGAGYITDRSNDTETAIELSNWTEISKIFTGYNFVLGLKTDGKVVGVGSLYGEIARDVEAATNKWLDVKHIYMNDYINTSYILGLKSNGEVETLGAFFYSLSSSINLDSWTDIVYIYPGYDFIIGLRSDGTLVGYGDYDPAILTWDLW